MAFPVFIIHEGMSLHAESAAKGFRLVLGFRMKPLGAVM